MILDPSWQSVLTIIQLIADNMANVEKNKRKQMMLVKMWRKGNSYGNENVKHSLQETTWSSHQKLKIKIIKYLQVYH